ncbi:hypothetical protein [Blastomonas fulva]
MLAALRMVLIKVFDCAVSHLDQGNMLADLHLLAGPDGLPLVCVPAC